MSIGLKTCAAVSAVAVALSGCGDLDSNAARGALIGAASGAILGGGVSSDGDRKKGRVIGAVIGGTVGGLVGQRLDQQEAALRSDLGDDRISIQNTGQELIVTMPQDILFNIDSTALRADLQRDLAALAGNLREFPNSRVDVVGHTDSTGDAAYNLGLSNRRAEAVQAVLVQNGVPAWRIRAVGRGETQPVASNQTANGRAQNRRVEIIITPTE